MVGRTLPLLYVGPHLPFFTQRGVFLVVGGAGTSVPDPQLLFLHCKDVLALQLDGAGDPSGWEVRPELDLGCPSLVSPFGITYN